MKQPSDWPGEWTKQIGRAVARHRKMKGLSAQALSDKCAEVGFSIPRNTITNLENGRKEGIPIHEVWVLAKALEVAPIDLLFPLVDEDGTLATDYREILDRARDFVDGWGARWEPDSEYRAYRRHDDNEGRASSRSRHPGANPEWVASGVEFLANSRTDLVRAGLPLPDVDEEISWWLEPDSEGIANYLMGRAREGSEPEEGQDG